MRLSVTMIALILSAWVLLTGVREAAATASKPAPKGVAIFVAAEKGQVAVVQKFLAGGGDVNAHDKNKLTLLNWAAYGGSLDLVKLLIGKGANINVHANKSAWTPLMNASATGFAMVVTTLLDHGADQALLDSDGYSALSYAAEKKHPDIVRILLTRGADGGLALVSLARASKIEAMNLLIESGVDADATPRVKEMWYTPGETALYRAASNNLTDVVVALLAKGANPDIAAPEGGNMSTPLMMAAYHCNAAMVDALIARTVTLGATNSRGETAADLAATGWTSDMKPCAADITAKLR